MTDLPLVDYALSYIKLGEPMLENCLTESKVAAKKRQTYISLKKTYISLKADTHYPYILSHSGLTDTSVAL